MKKKKIIIWAAVLFVASFIFALLFYDTFYRTQITADRLSIAYSTDRTKADELYLDKVIDVKGTVKAYYTLLQTSKVLELNTKDKTLPIICIFLDQKNRWKTGNLREGQVVMVTGKCAGVSAYSFVKGVKIEVEDIDTE